jgi:hypothetical protein
MNRQELLPHQEGASAAVERVLRYVPGLRAKVEPMLRENAKLAGIPASYADMTPAECVAFMALAEGCCRKADFTAQLFPSTRTGWREAGRRWGVFDGDGAAVYESAVSFAF